MIQSLFFGVGFIGCVCIAVVLGIHFSKSRNWILKKGHHYFLRSRWFLVRLMRNYQKQVGPLITYEQRYQFKSGRDFYLEYKPDGSVVFFLGGKNRGIHSIPQQNLQIIWVEGLDHGRAILWKQVFHLDHLFCILSRLKPELPKEWGRLFLPAEWQADSQKVIGLTT